MTRVNAVKVSLSLNVGSRLRIQPISATFYALAREEDVANGIQTEDLLYGSSEGADVGSLANR